MSDFKLTPAREKELEKIARDLPDKSFKDLYGKDWKSVKIATAMNILKKKYGFKTEETKMKFKEIREKVRGGKLDPLSPMGKSKLTGAEISRYYKDNPMAKRAARDATVKKAIELALDLGGSMNYAMKEIEKLKRGLSKNKEVAKALRFANESVNKEAASPEEKAQLALKHAKEKEQLQKKQATEKERLASESVREGFLDRGKTLHKDKDNLFFIIQDREGIKLVVDRDKTQGTAGSISRGEKLDDYEFEGFADYMAMSPSHFRKFLKAIKKVKV